jgi:hypothetical protein
MLFESYQIKLLSEIDFFQMKFHEIFSEMKILTTLTICFKSIKIYQ